MAISGRLLAPELLGEVKTRPPIMLIHGDRDPVVPFAEMDRAAEALAAAGFDVYGHIMEGTPHGIAPDGLSVTMQFLKEHLPH